MDMPPEASRARRTANVRLVFVAERTTHVSEEVSASPEDGDAPRRALVGRLIPKPLDGALRTTRPTVPVDVE
jgi:hypothetical protein